MVKNTATGAVVAERLVAEAEAVFSGLPANANVTITVTARNTAGESQPSAGVPAVVP